MYIDYKQVYEISIYIFLSILQMQDMQMKCASWVI